MMIRRFFLTGLLLIVATAACARGPEEGKPAPSLEARLLQGGQFSLAQASGKVVVINFWATWCAPCRQEMPALDAYYLQHHAQGLEVLAIALDDAKTEAKVSEVMRAFAFPAALAREASFRGYGRIWRLPLTFVVDRHGVLRKDGWYGDPGIDSALLEKVVTPLLNSP